MKGYRVALATTCTPRSKLVGETVTITIGVRNIGNITIPTGAYVSFTLVEVGISGSWTTTSPLVVGASQNFTSSPISIDETWSGKSVACEARVYLSQADWSSGKPPIGSGSCVGLVNVSVAVPSAEIVSITAA